MKKILFIILLLNSGLSYGEPKATNKGILLSILLPGLGEQYFGDTKGAIRGYLTEGVIWTTYFTAKWYAGNLAHNYDLYSKMNTRQFPEYQVQSDMKSTYYDAMEWYESIEVYNTMIREEARSYYPDTLSNAREEQLKYIKENSISDSLSWKWTDMNKWDEFRQLRKTERDIIQKAGYCIGIALANRLVSALMVAYKVPQNYGLNIESNGIQLNYMFK
ncbi:MAG: hypothetical protein PHE49_07460 [bacterium]|nr:hypothetical protein [bacterium]